ncbi:hypothetical protein [Dipodfec virus UOA04_Rod_1057]|nr:hypothetical protein [Dipodfec virus UOA04_Rod_1057]
MRFYSVRQLAKMYRISQQAVLEWIAYGKVDAFQIGHDWRVFDDGTLYDKAISPCELRIRTRRKKVC